MKNSQQIIVDSDAFVALMWEKDNLHSRAKETLAKLRADGVQLITTSSVVDETATVLSHRKGQDLARTFLDEFIKGSNFPVVWIDENMRDQGLNIFKGLTKKGSSVTDCINAALCKHLQLTSIFSFDQVYPKSFDIGLAHS